MESIYREKMIILSNSLSLTQIVFLAFEKFVLVWQYSFRSKLSGFIFIVKFIEDGFSFFWLPINVTNEIDLPTSKLLW